VGRGKAIDGVVKRLRTRVSRRLRVQAHILFGSRTEGRADEWSDYDFIVVSPDFEGTPFLERGRLIFPLRERDVSCDFLCCTAREYRELASRPTLVKEASERGIPIL
jgi:predicted nucleotidyltransferase